VKHPIDPEEARRRLRELRDQLKQAEPDPRKQARKYIKRWKEYYGDFEDVMYDYGDPWGLND